MVRPLLDARIRTAPAIPVAGLGLTLVKVAAARMRGELHVGPGLGGRGCCFVLEIPID